MILIQDVSGLVLKRDLDSADHIRYHNSGVVCYWVGGQIIRRVALDRPWCELTYNELHDDLCQLYDLQVFERDVARGFDQI